LETRRTEPFTPGIARLALTRLLEGPDQTERAASVATQIPAGTTIHDITISNVVATVDLSESFESNPSSASMPLRIAQVVYTLTQFPTVRGVDFRIDGQAKTVVGGIPMQQPQTAAMYEGELPAILVESPAIAVRVGTPVTVSGTANVFEARVTVRILDANGHEIARTFTQASCGTGCRGTYSVSVTFRVGSEQAGTIEVFDASSKDGSPENVQDIPVTLTP